jgi:hypothetical protein
MGTETAPLEKIIERESRNKFKINRWGTLTGVAIGILTRLGVGEQAYRLPGGAAAAGILFTIIPRGLKTPVMDYFVNIANCEIGYYAGVIATDRVLSLIQ